MAAVKPQIPPYHSGYLSEYHGFSHIIQHSRNLHSQILKYPVGQTLKA